MLIGEATLKTATYGRRLTLLLGELRAAGCTVWLEGLRVRFDLPGRHDDAQETSYRQAAQFDSLLRRYSDVVSWVPLRELEPADEVTPPVRRAGPFGWRRAAARTVHD